VLYAFYSSVMSVYLSVATFCGGLAGHVLICCSVLVRVYGDVSWFSENEFCVMLIYRRLEL
jgi:hypothetical protein